MDISALGAVWGLMGSLVGGSATVATAWITQRTLNRRELIREEMRKRETLYGEFIGECGRLLVDAFANSLDEPEKLLPVYALINRIRLAASRPVLAEAERLLRHITDQYFASNLTVDEMRQLTLSGQADPLEAFGEACRAELKLIRAGL
ncbi:MAG TPA: hypothetical protein VMG60_15060 [Burkholderiaceae bacterium]|nr:hypothetical protein [Burkholderiaceae bacterium]